MVNAYEPHFDEQNQRYGFSYRRARLGYQCGCQDLGLSLWELPPGAEGVYHFHYGNEELLIVLGPLTAGQASLRTPAGWRELEQGELVAFPRGPRGAHVVANRGDDPIRLLFFSEMHGPEVVIYPAAAEAAEAGAVAALEAMSAPEKGGFAAWLRLEDAFERHDVDAGGTEVPAATPSLANLFRPCFDEQRDRPGFSLRRARLGRQAGSEKLGASCYELPDGQAAWPYHYHLANEELMLVVSGTVELRTPSGSRELSEGELASFPAGAAGAHQIRNDSGSAARVLVVSEMRAPDAVVHLDSGKIGVRGQPPGAPDEGALQAWFRLDHGVPFWQGE